MARSVHAGVPLFSFLVIVSFRLAAADRFLLRHFSAFCREDCSPSRGVGIAVGKVLVSDGECRAHDPEARAGDAPPARARDLGHQSVDVETMEHTTDLGAGLLGIVREGSAGESELVAQIPIGETVYGVLAAHDGRGDARAVVREIPQAG